MKTSRSSRTAHLLAVLCIGVLFLISAAGSAHAEPAAGQNAPVFSLKGLKGETVDLSHMKDRAMIILYFFDADSRPSQEGLLSLNRFAKQFRSSGLTVLAVTASTKEKASAFAGSSGLDFPILLDKGDVSKQYVPAKIFPTVCILGPKLKVLDYYQGGGKTSETLMVRVAERQLQRKQVVLAKAISDDLIRKDPQNVKAKTVKGYAALREGKYGEAENEFREVAKKGGQAEILGKEGLAAVYAKNNQPDKALELARELETRAPERSYAHVVKGDILYAQNKRSEAEAEYQKAVKKKSSEPYQEGVRYNQLGRLYAGSGNYGKAREMYDQALRIDPYYIEGTTNKGVTYEKEGKWDKALEAYREALALDKSDSFAVMLAKKAQEMLEVQKDAEKKKRIDKLVKELAERYRGTKDAPAAQGDEWTSRPMVISFVDFQEKGGLAERDGFSMILTSQLADQLNASGRVKVVERVVIDRLLEELNIGSSELANQDTALRLGRILSAKLIGTGTLFYSPHETILSFRMIDTETSGIPQVLNRQWGSQTSIDKEIFQLNREILRTVIQRYPVRGFVARAAGDTLILNVGAKQGVVPGTKFEILEDQEPVTYKGKTLKVSAKPVGQIEIERVEPELSHARVLKSERPVKMDDKVQEKIEEIAAK